MAVVAKCFALNSASSDSAEDFHHVHGAAFTTPFTPVPDVIVDQRGRPSGPIIADPLDPMCQLLKAHSRQAFPSDREIAREPRHSCHSDSESQRCTQIVTKPE